MSEDVSIKMVVTMDKNGRIVIPSNARRYFGYEEGTLWMIMTDKEIRLIRMKPVQPEKVNRE